jgi:hypothetical protein
MSAFTCEAAAFLDARGPAVVPFRLCCVLAIRRAGGPVREPVVCGAITPDPAVAELWAGTEPDVPSVGEPAR